MKDDEEDEHLFSDKDRYTVEQLNMFLDETKGKSDVEFSNYFPDLGKFVLLIGCLNVNVMRDRK